MSAQNKELVRSTAPGSSGMVVPQGHDPVADAWVPIKVAADGTLLAQLSGSMIAKEKDKAVTANTDILTDYTATQNMNSTIMVLTGTGGTLSLEVDGILGSLNGGTALDAGRWYAFDIPITATSVYNLKFSVNATMQIKWIGGV